MKPKGPWAELTIPLWFRTRQGRVQHHHGECAVSSGPGFRSQEPLGEEVWAPPSHCGWATHSTEDTESWAPHRRSEHHRASGACCIPTPRTFLQPVRRYLSIRLEPRVQILAVTHQLGLLALGLIPSPVSCGHLKSFEDEMTCTFVKYLAQRS